MFNIRQLNAVINRTSSTSNSRYNSASRDHNSLIANKTPTLYIHSIGNGKRTITTTAKPTLTLDSMNLNVIKMGNVVRGPLLTRASEIEREIKEVSIHSISVTRIMLTSFFFHLPGRQKTIPECYSCQCRRCPRHRTAVHYIFARCKTYKNIKNELEQDALVMNSWTSTY